MLTNEKDRKESKKSETEMTDNDKDLIERAKEALGSERYYKPLLNNVVCALQEVREEEIRNRKKTEFALEIESQALHKTIKELQKSKDLEDRKNTALQLFGKELNKTKKLSSALSKEKALVDELVKAFGSKNLQHYFDGIGGHIINCKGCQQKEALESVRKARSNEENDSYWDDDTNVHGPEEAY